MTIDFEAPFLKYFQSHGSDSGVQPRCQPYLICAFFPLQGHLAAASYFLPSGHVCQLIASLLSYGPPSLPAKFGDTSYMQPIAYSLKSYKPCNRRTIVDLETMTSMLRTSIVNGILFGLLLPQNLVVRTIYVPSGKPSML